MAAVACDFPPDSALNGGFVQSADHVDAFKVPLARHDRTVTDLFYGVFAHRPYWLRLLLAARNAIASVGGLETTPAAETLRPRTNAQHAVGDTIGGWRIFALSTSELVVGRDNAHMDFRLSVSKSSKANASALVVATVCRTNNAFGRRYLAAILPFHKRGVKMLLDNAVAAHRI